MAGMQKSTRGLPKTDYRTHITVSGLRAPFKSLVLQQQQQPSTTADIVDAEDLVEAT